MAETRDSLLEHYAKVRGVWAEAIQGLTDEQMVETSIDGWSVKDNMAHLSYWDDLRADEIIRISIGFETALKMTPEQDAVTSLMHYELRKNLSLRQIKWEFEHSGHRLVEAINAAPPGAFDPTKYGEAGLVSSHAAMHAEYVKAWRAKLGY